MELLFSSPHCQWWALSAIWAPGMGCIPQYVEGFQDKRCFQGFATALTFRVITWRIVLTWYLWRRPRSLAGLSYFFISSTSTTCNLSWCVHPTPKWWEPATSFHFGVTWPLLLHFLYGLLRNSFWSYFLIFTPLCRMYSWPSVSTGPASVDSTNLSQMENARGKNSRNLKKSKT